MCVPENSQIFCKSQSLRKIWTNFLLNGISCNWRKNNILTEWINMRQMESLDITLPDQVSRTEAMARGVRSPICGNQWLPPQSSNKGWKSHRQLFRPDSGPSVWCTDGHGFSSTDLVRWRNIQWFHLSQIPSHWAMCTKSPFDYRVLSHAWLLASTCFYWNHKCFTWGGFRSSRSSDMTISTPHWWPPIRAKQLSVALPSFVGWLGRRSLVATNRALCPPGLASVLLTWSGGVISNDSICHKFPHTGQCVQNPHLTMDK